MNNILHYTTSTFLFSSRCLSVPCYFIKPPQKTQEQSGKLIQECKPLAPIMNSRPGHKYSCEYEELSWYKD